MVWNFIKGCCNLMFSEVDFFGRKWRLVTGVLERSKKIIESISRDWLHCFWRSNLPCSFGENNPPPKKKTVASCWVFSEPRAWRQNMQRRGGGLKFTTSSLSAVDPEMSQLLAELRELWRRGERATPVAPKTFCLHTVTFNWEAVVVSVTLT